MVYMYHSFLIHLSADGHLGSFHVQSIVNSAAMNTGYTCSWQIESLVKSIVKNSLLPLSGKPQLILLSESTACLSVMTLQQAPSCASQTSFL